MIMKAKNIVFAIVLSLFALSCTRFEDPVFSESASTRMESFLDNAQEVLLGAKEGWYMEYYPDFAGETMTSGGTIYTLKFDAKQVTVLHESQTTSAGKTNVSGYKLTQDDGPVLSVDTYNEPFHYYCTASSSYYQAQGGDFEFDIVSATPEKVVLRGKRNHNICTMYPLQEPAESFIKKIQDMVDRFSIGMVETTITGGAVEMEIDLNDRYVYLGRKDAADDEISGVPFVFTPNGLKLYEPVYFQGATFTEFTYVSDSNRLVSNETEYGQFGFDMIIPEGYLPYGSYVGKFLLKNALGQKEVTLSVGEAGRTIILSGLSEKYDITLRYSTGRGVLYLYVQQIGTVGGSQYWLTVSDGGTFTWSTAAAMVTVVDDEHREDFTLSFKDAGFYESVVASSLWLAEFTGAPSSDTYVRGGIKDPDWMFFGKDPEMSTPITLTKIIE